MKRLLPVLLLLSIAGAGLWWWRRAPEPALDMTLYGNVELRSLSLAFEGSGRLAELSVEEGAAVKAGQLLGRLRGRHAKEAVAIAEAAVAVAKARLTELKAGARPQAVAEANAQLSLRRAQLAQAEREDKRQRSLSGTSATTTQRVEQAHTAAEVARASVRAARARRALLLAGARAETIRAAEAAVEVTKAQLSSAKTALEDTQLIAPADAVVEDRLLEPGAMVSPARPVLSLSLRQPLFVRAYLTEPQLGRVALGQGASVGTDSGDQRYRGHVGFISSVAEFTPRAVQTPELRTQLMYRLRIVIDEPAPTLNRGQPVTVRLDD